MELGELERLAANPNYKLSPKQQAKLERLRKENYTQKNKRPKSNDKQFSIHETNVKVEETQKREKEQREN